MASDKLDRLKVWLGSKKYSCLPAVVNWWEKTGMLEIAVWEKQRGSRTIHSRMYGGVENADKSASIAFPKLCVTGNVDSRQGCLIVLNLAA